MAERAPDRREAVVRPLRIWAALLLLGAASLGYALLPGAPFKLGVALAIFAVQAMLVGGAFMNLGRASPLIRVTAAAGSIWLGFLFLLAFADLLTR
jgi:cytochrome c oxidase subunit IV